MRGSPRAAMLEGMKSAARIPGLVAVGLAVAVLAAGCANKPVLKPDGRSVTQARKAAREQLDRDLAAVTQGVPEFHLLARAELDTCSRGRDNWKTQDAFRSECHLRVAAAYTFAGKLAPRATALHSVLSGRGWTGGWPHDGGIPAMLEEYWDTGRDRPRYDPGPPAAGYRQGTPTPSGSKSLADIPRTLQISFASADQPDDRQIGGTAAEMATDHVRVHDADGLEYYRTVHGTPWAAPWHAARKPGTRLVVLLFEEHYARN